MEHIRIHCFSTWNSEIIIEPNKTFYKALCLSHSFHSVLPRRRGYTYGEMGRLDGPRGEVARLGARLRVLVRTICSIISFLAPNLSPSATIVFLDLLMRTWNTSTPVKKVVTLEPSYSFHSRMYPSLLPETRISLS